MYNELNTYGIQAQPMQLYKAMRRAIEEMEGKYAKSYKIIQNYAKMPHEKNPRSVINIGYQPRIDMNPP